MMKAVFEPSNLFISEIEWQNQESRDKFLEHLLDNLKNISDYEITKIYWTDELEEILWEHPQLPPWRQDRDWKIQIVPIIYKLFNSVKENLPNHKQLTSCTVQPGFNSQDPSDLILNYFLELIHILIDRNENIYLCLGIKTNKQEYIFSCKCHDFKVHPTIIENPIQWLNYIDIINTYWPSSVNEIDKLHESLKILFKIHNSQPIQEYEFSPQFVKDIIKATNHREKILQSIVKRLLLTKQQAAKDMNLQDEYLKPKKEYRFRVTPRPASTRIHYKYAKNKILFLKYYDEGEHDEGL
ncbi:hypothetical protein FJR38_08490 [Anabaena sp. UHCC 0253]|uniref:hypothetical protein n=1 Tax=Anabaena sp. UHCC 0253 TaxID=2590019 RepID=UPI001446713F|nr:hypothetical protein [Anabaena sp. UHCC 0253]MTJ52694.1 hypothetical protein [Anabaena sp. UHCC 0253]